MADGTVTGRGIIEVGIWLLGQLHQFGDAADIIIDQAKQWPADLIVLGTHGRRGIKRLALGSDAELVLRMSPVPVLLVRDPPEESH